MSRSKRSPGRTTVSTRAPALRAFSWCRRQLVSPYSNASREGGRTYSAFVPVPASSGAIRTTAHFRGIPVPARSTAPAPARFRPRIAAGGVGSDPGVGSIARRSSASRSGRSAETMRSASASRFAASRAASSRAWLSPMGRGSSSAAAPWSRARARASGSGAHDEDVRAGLDRGAKGMYEQPAHEVGPRVRLEDRSESAFPVGERTDGDDDPGRAFHDAGGRGVLRSGGGSGRAGERGSSPRS